MKKDDPHRGTTVPEAKGTGREGGGPQSQADEFADDLRVNRFTPPPPPPASDEDETQKRRY